MKAVRGRPQVFDEVDQIDDDRDRHADALGRSLNCGDLVAVPVQQHHPAALALGVAGECLAKPFVDDLREGAGNAAEDSLVHGARPRGPGLLRRRRAQALELPDDVVGSSEERRYRVDRPHLRHALAVRLLPGLDLWGERRVGRFALGLLSRRRAERLRAHHDTCGVEREDQQGAIRHRFDRLLLDFDAREK